MQKLAAMDDENGDVRADEKNQSAIVHRVIADFLDRLFELEAITPEVYVGSLAEIAAIPEEWQGALAELQGGQQEAAFLARNPPNPNTPRGREREEEPPTTPAEGGEDAFTDLASEIYASRLGAGAEPVSVDPGEQDRIKDEEYEAWKSQRRNRRGAMR